MHSAELRNVIKNKTGRREKEKLQRIQRFNFDYSAYFKLLMKFEFNFKIIKKCIVYQSFSTE